MVCTDEATTKDEHDHSACHKFREGGEQYSNHCKEQAHEAEHCQGFDMSLLTGHCSSP